MAEGQDHDDKTEAPSGRRIEKAREAGQVALSPELPALAVLASAVLVLTLIAPGTTRDLVRQLSAMVEQAHMLDPAVSLRSAIVVAATVAAPFVLGALLSACAANVGQTGFLMNFKTLKPDIARVSPGRGMARVFGASALIQSGKSLAKIAMVGFAGWTVLADSLPTLSSAMHADAGWLTDRTLRMVQRVMLAMIAAQAVIAALDVVLTRLRHTRSLRMSRQEQREEVKEMDGDPQVKGRLKNIRMQRARRRMLAAVPKATVVITNPTHYAVALSYSRDGGDAPRIVAKGVDNMAARIREVAAEHGVPIVANPPLARALYPHELDREIPAAFYKQVAEIIAYVWRLRGMAA